jgi:predicted phage baseplate assembly protein
LQVATLTGSIVFQTIEELRVSPARLVSVRVARADTLIDRTSENTAPRDRYAPFGRHPRPGDALMLGFDQPLGTPGDVVSLYMWTGEDASDRRERARLIEEYDEAFAEASLSCPAGFPADVVPWQRHYGVSTAWEYWAGDVAGFRPLPSLVDETRALTLGGAIRFAVPADAAPGGPAPDLHWIRCRIVAGAFERVPMIERVALNAVAARHAADADAEELLGASDGRARQVFTIATARGEVLPSSTRLRVLEGNVEKGSWVEAAFWDEVGAHDRSYVLDREAGTIHMGDGRVGAVPATGAELRLSYQTGGGAAGNVPRDSLTAVVDGPHNATLVPAWADVRPTLRVTQPAPAQGGAEAETLAEGQARAVDWLAACDRAVTLTDFETLALETPGVPLGRAHAVAELHPGLRCTGALGCVTLVVVPDGAGAAPTPSPDFLRTVARYLERRRTLTTELHVVGPRYTRVSVRARLHAPPHLDRAVLRAQALEALTRYLHPLHGGPDAAGWPLGRPVYRAEVMALLCAVPGVEHVDQLDLIADGEREPRCGNLDLCPDGLVESGAHSLQVASRSPSR